MVANTGTYEDAPAHRFPGGTDVGSLPLKRLADLDAVVIDLLPLPAGESGGERRRRAFDADHFQGRALEGKAVLLRSGWDVHWRTPEYNLGHPYVTRRGAETLVEAGPALVGIDSLNIDDTEDGARPAHTLLFAAGIPVVEHLRGLDSLPAAGFRFHCVPAPFCGVGSFPARAYAVVEEKSP